MIPALLVHWTRDKDGVGCWKVQIVNSLNLAIENTALALSTSITGSSMRYPTKIEALECANELFKHEEWVLLTVLNRDGSQDHCTSKFKDGPLWSYLLTDNKLGGRDEKQSSCEVRTASQS